ncbi:MAG TPA: trypsin-like peptidase domain-containing protein [Streptosporangiaceae bacterium]|nr:trypsin-like peptidase domain-containing protein [Streptosporangiaceae bacterium]
MPSSSTQPGAGGPYIPSGPEGPYGPGGGASGPGGRWPAGRPRRRGLAFGAAGVALAVAAAFGSYDLVNSGGTTTGSATASADTVLSTSQIAAEVSPGLVDVNATLGYRKATSAGTGLVLTSTGEVLTNNHVIDGATSITVTDVENGRTYKATVVGYDASKDLAVLQLQRASGLKTVTLGDSSTVKVGQKVVAIGNAGGKGGTPSVVTGKVTALGQSITASDASSGTAEQLSGMIETSAPIQAGDSGGPLVNTAGQVIGIDTAASSSPAVPTGQTQASTSGQNLGQSQTQATAFSIPINEAESIAAQIEAGTSSSTIHLGATAFLGIEASSASSAGSGAGGGFGFGGAGDGSTGTAGVTVIGTLSGSPAAQAGLTAGDEITSLGGQTVTSESQIQSILAAHHPGDKISISWTDSFGQAHTATIVLAAGPAA